MSVPQCSISTGSLITQCYFINNKTAMIFITSQSSQTITGTITNFINPKSMRNVDSIQISLFDRVGNLKVVSQSLSLYNFMTSSLSVSLSSSSNLIGQQNQYLTINIAPWTLLTSSGQVIVSVPQYYQGAVNDYLISGQNLNNCSCSIGTVYSCTFSPRLMQVTIMYNFTNNKDTSQPVKFVISNFNNPLTYTQSGFKVKVLDQNQYQISQTFLDIQLANITQAQNFSSFLFNYIDYSNNGQLATHEFLIESSIAVQQGCIIRIIYPIGMQITNELIYITGTGLFEPEGGALIFQTNLQNNSVDIISCQQNFGQQNSGTLRLSKVQNQMFIHDLDSFKIYMTGLQDTQFKQYYQSVQSGFKVLKEQQLPGLIISNIVFESTLISTFTTLKFFLQPTIAMTKNTYLLIDIPNLILFQTRLCTVSEIVGFSQNIDCVRNGQKLNLTTVFDSNFDPLISSELQIKIEDFLLPNSVQNLGTINLEFYDYSNYTGKFDIINSCQFTGLQTTSGKITQVQNVVPSSTIANQKYAQFIFHFSTQHSVPINGQFSIILTQDNLNGVYLPDDSSTVKTNCFLMLQTGDKLVECIIGTTDYLSLPYVNITCTPDMFGDTGAPANQDVKFKVTGLTNPRSINQKNYFKIYTTDDKLNYIDENQEDQQFFVAMDTLSKIDLITVSFDNQTNGAFATYTFNIVPSHLVLSGDIFSVNFPPQLIISPNISCGTLDSTLVQSVSCLQTYGNQIDFHLDLVSPSYVAGQVISLSVGNITNPYSTRATDNFSNMHFRDFEYQNMISKYSGKFNISTQTVSYLSSNKVSITQSSYNPNQDSIVQLSFYTNNPLSSLTAIQLFIPNTLQQVYSDSLSCVMTLNGVISKNSNCSFSQFSILYINGFQQFNQLFIGHIQLQFKTQNPVSNLQIGTQSYNISIFDESTLQYGVDQLINAFYPSLLCAYPCNTCAATNTQFCLSCLSNVQQAPQYLTSFDPNNNQTCLNSCPSGFTTNGKNNSCTQCSSNCLTCADNGNAGDYNICTSCNSQNPYLQVSNQQCVAVCPLGTYLSKNQCFQCPSQCAACSDNFTCTKCNLQSNLSLLYNGNCYKTCPSGSTQIVTNCVKCNYPCLACDTGLINSCQSCDNTYGQFFIYGKSCFQQCPDGSTQLQGTNQCFDCDVGCKVCDSVVRKKCLQCSQGFSIHDNICSSECPNELQKSADGTTCNPRFYPLNASFLFFPFIDGAIFFFLVTIGSYFATGRQSLVSSTLIAFFGPIEMAINAFLLYLSFIPSLNFQAFTIGLIGTLSTAVFINIVFVIIFVILVQNKDKLFIKWREKRIIQTNFLLIISGTISITLFRLIYSKLFENEQFNPNVKNPVKFLRPILVFTWIKFICFNMPFVYMMYRIFSQDSWGNVAYTTTLEGFAINLMTFILMIWETFKRNDLLQKGSKYKKQQYQNLDDKSIIENHHKHNNRDDQLHPHNSQINDIENKEQIEISMDKIMFHLRNNVSMEELKLADEKHLPNSKSHFHKIQKLANIIEIVKKNQDMFLNNEMDKILDLEYNQEQKMVIRSNSMYEQKNIMNSEQISQQSDQVKSLPGSSINENELFDKFQQYLEDQKPAETEESVKQKSQGDQYVDPEDNNIYFSARDKNLIQFAEQNVQTDQEKGIGSILQMNQVTKDTIFDAMLQKREDQRYNKKKIDVKTRRGGKGYYKSEKQEDKDFQEKYKNKLENLSKIEEQSDQINQMSIDNKIDENQSLLQIDQMIRNQSIQEIKKQNQNLRINFDSNEGSTQINQLQFSDTRRMNESRISGDLDFSDSDDSFMEINSFQKQVNGLTYKEVNHRNFNINEIIGNFERDWLGKIQNKQQILRQYNYRDREGKIVNQAGYLINENTGDIVSRYSKQTVFHQSDLLGKGQNQYQVPIIYRIENHNFNPHQIMGNFDYKNDKLIVLKDNFGNQLDKNFRKVNSGGWLVDKEGNVIDNLGHIKFNREQLKNHELQELYNYQGKGYRIKDIIGQFDKNKISKQIIIGQNESRLVDKLDREVNSKGYLVDSEGNIIGKNKELIWNKNELYDDEPPKIFEFTEFSIDWILGKVNEDLRINPDKNIKYDKENRKINQLGYLIDDDGNIVDTYHGKILFQKDLLQFKYGQQCEIPYVFVSGRLRNPDGDIYFN